MEIKVVTVLGANGTMGSNVSGIFASFGNAKVYMISRNLEDSKKAASKSALSVKAEAINKNLIPKTYEDLEECIKESDLIFESVFESFETKKEIFNEVSKYLKKDTIISTGTSGLSINKLAMCLPEKFRENFLGIHMYNPPYNMTLCEVIPSNLTNKKILSLIKIYLKGTLLRDVVEIKDEPAFMGNRIGFQLINQALQYAEKYKELGGIDYIDSILGLFSGRSMAPLVTSNFVGLDVHKAIVDNIYENTNDFAHKTFVMPDYANKLISENKLGRKTGVGLYKTIISEEGVKSIYVYDIASGDYRLKKNYKFPFALNMIKELKNGNYSKAFKILKFDEAKETKLCLEFLLKYVIYSLFVNQAIGEDINSADVVMATGFNWAPPLAIIDALGGEKEFLEVANNNLDKKYLNNVDLTNLVKGISRSLYDYRPFFKAK